MATSPNLPIGAFITTLGGRRCTALPRTDINSVQTSTTSTFSTSVILSTSSAAAALAPQLAPQVVPQASPAVVPQVAPVPAAQNSVEQTVPAPAPAAATTSAATTGQFSAIASPSPSSLLPPESPESPLSAAVAVPQPQASVTDSTTTALSTALTTAEAATTPAAAAAAATPTSETPTAAETTGGTTPVPQVAPVPAQSEVLESDTAATAAATPFTTIGLGSTTVAGAGGAESTGNTVTAAAGSGSHRSNGNGSTVAVAGGVVGGVALVSLIAFLIWFWRRRSAKRHRDTLLTPLSADPSFGRDIRNEKTPYLIHRDSIGPTPRSTKVKAALRAQYGRVRGRFDTLARSTSVRSNGSHSSGPSVDMNRGNSQFMDSSPISTHQRSGSSALSSARDDSEPTMKERIMEMWTRFIGSGKQNMAGDDRNDIFAARGITGAMSEKPMPSARRPSNKPDFLTLLNMDDGELDREAQKRRMSRRGGSEGSGLLNLDFGGNPFSDVHALGEPRNGPPMASGANNPFSDANAIIQPPKPSTYVDGIRRSRHQSLGSSTVDLSKPYDIRGLRVVNEETRRQDSTFFRDSQASASSIETFATKRDKFRSDPFDLEQLSSQVSGSIPNYTARPGFTSTSNFSTDATRFSSSGSISMQYQMSVGSSLAPGAVDVTRPPAAAHARNRSDVSSKYTSGFSAGTLDEWSEPGPDVGPAAMRYDASRRSSSADAFNPYSTDDYASLNSGSRRTSKSDSVKMGYAL